MRFVDASQINAALTFPILVRAMEDAHRREKMEVKDSLLGNQAAAYFVRSAVDPGRFMASKLVTSFPGNPSTSRRPAVQAVVVMFDATGGRPLIAIDGTELTHWRTAADSALGAKLLAGAEPATLLVIGAGEMCRWLVRAHCCVRPSLSRVIIWNRGYKRAADVAEGLRREGFPAEAATDLRQATRIADVVCACTSSLEPLVKGADLKEGAHVDLVGGYTPEMRESDDDAIRRADVFVDRLESAFDVGDILQPLASGALKEQDILGDHYDLARGKIRGRLSPDQITLFKNAGGGHLDLMTAEAILRNLGEPIDRLDR